ncbi:hypothetical protein K443DRAFT_15298 [Laccaria amethystina LaAM-08-1]|uniref:Uncharacterized protein n=1 Tax=Laccaria amethystina LaAM-08-1 TaxID=1095629 RepID=A0A0C9WLK2_9AGAR|nr:hypothetical protein K443DRAFT_15298 [Laccaria amethystina LaAM-08-1]
MTTLHRRNVSIYIHVTIPGWVDFCLDIDYMYQRPPNGGTSTRQSFSSFHLLHHFALKPSSLKDDVSPFANHLHTSSIFFDRPKMPCTTLQLPEPFYFTMGFPGFDTTYRRPLNALSICGSR